MYQLLETRPDVEFDFILAERLKMTVAELRARMSTAEWLGWNVHLARQEQHRQMAQMGG
jgi:hypothetical protein